ncbi:probable transcriptional regulator SLK2 [Zingiber officinale]|uniref:probable transcriptional regulator SLK2 n=1 Tax=Zingiber officinale TaxID=94328 RepID=UPI001C4CCC41|nr:probable transcriptional regulator SLK2 [Zingiber officinale]XP_042388698.1 probable transcriptional regulator SLK2 [Zingiber officinale]
MSGPRYSGVGPASGDINQMIKSTGNISGPSVGASSLVTDANSAFSGVSQLQRSTSLNNESYMRLPASPMSFSSNISGSSVMDGCSIVQQSSLQEQVQRQGLSTATSQLIKREPPSASMNAQKRARLDGMHDDALQQQLIQQLLQRNESMQSPQGLQSQQLQAIFQEQRLMQNQHQQLQMMHSLSQMQRPPITLQQQQLHHLMKPNLPPTNSVKQPLPLNTGICFRRLMQYLYHLRHRPADNSILYWRKFVTEYFAPRARKRWCLSLCDNTGNHTFGVFPQLAVDGWQCDVCGSKSGKGFEATFEVLPRLFQIKCDHGVVDENLFLDMPHECRLSSGIMVLKYERAVHENIFEHLRTVHEGQLQIIFTPELKILSWEFCARRHEEFIPRRLVAPQVNQVLQVAQKYRTAVTENSSTEISHQDLQSSCNMFAAAGRQLARNLDSQSVNDLGFSKRFVRCLQIAEVVCSMKDLIDFSQEQKVGAIESLKNYPRHAATKLLKVEPGMLMSAHCLIGEQSLDKVVSNHPGLSGYINKNLTAGQVLTNSQQNVHASNNYQSLLRNPSNLNQSMFYQDALSSPRGSKHTQPASIQGSASASLTDASVNKLPGQQPLPFDSQTLQVNQHLPQHVLQQMLHGLRNKRTEQQSFSSPNGSNSLRMGAEGTRIGIEVQNMSNNNLPGNTNPAVQSRSNSFKSTASANNPSIGSTSTNRRSDLSENLDLQEFEVPFKNSWRTTYLMGNPGDDNYGWNVEVVKNEKTS